MFCISICVFGAARLDLLQLAVVNVGPAVDPICKVMGKNFSLK